MESGDQGHPIALDETNPMGIAFTNLAQATIERIEWRNKEMDATKKVEMQDGAGCSTE